MGSDTKLYLLDIDSFHSHITPGFHQLLSGKTLPGWLTYLIEASDFSEMPQLIPHFVAYPVYLKTYCTYLSDDLACIDPGRFNDNLGRRPRSVSHLHYDHPLARRCAERSCLIHQNCPFYLDNKMDVDELLNYLFEDAVAWVSEGKGVFVGRTTFPSSYEKELSALGVPEEAVLRELLDRLGTRGFIFGYGWANGDGVQGWLDEQECAQVAQQLWQLDLLQYPATSETLEEWQPLKIKAKQPEPQYSWNRTILAYIRAMAEYAAQRGRGIVWMNDVPLRMCVQFGTFREWIKSN